MKKRIEGPCLWCGRKCRSVRRLCQVCSFESALADRTVTTYADALTGGNWIRGRGGVHRWVPERDGAR